MDSMSFFAIPSFINLIIKLWLFWYGRESIFTKNRFLGLLLLSFFSLNLVEFLQYYLNDELHALANILAYWLVAVIAATVMLIFADKLTYQRIPVILPIVVIAIFSYFIIFTRTLISGVDSIGYSITRIPGSYYWVLQCYILISVLGSAVLLLCGGLFHKDMLRRKKCSVVFFALLPVVVATVIILSLMQIGLKVNAALVVTTAITCFLAILIFTEIHYSLFNILTATPVISLQVSRQIIKLMVDICRKRSIKLKSFLQGIENILIVVALEVNEGNRKRTARQLDMHISSLNKKLQKFHNGG
jgi:hypothetical protein